MNYKISFKFSTQGFILFLFIGLWAFSLITVWKKINHFDGWAIADWLIHYQDGGFKRRGLLGTFFLFIAEYLPIKGIMFLFIGVIYSAFYFLIYRFTLKIDLMKNALFLLILPGILLYPVFEKAVIGRKEILLMLYFAMLCYRFPKKIFYQGLMVLGYFLLILIHEMAFFFLPYLCLLIYKEYKDVFLRWITISSLFILSCVLLLLIKFYGHEINCGQSLQNLQNIGYPIICESNLNDCSIFAWIQDASFLIRFQNGFLSIAEYVFSYTIYLFIIGYFVRKEYRRGFFILTAAFTIFSLPLFYLGIDWGRWINIHLCLIVFLLMKYPFVLKTQLLKPYYYILIFLLAYLFLTGHSSDGFLLFY